jgi:hypothetical protein
MANETIAWSGGVCPVGADERVDIKLRNGTQLNGVRASDVLDWGHHQSIRGPMGELDVIAYRIHTPPPPMD